MGYGSTSTMRPKGSSHGKKSKKGAKYAGTQPTGKKTRYVGAVS